MRRALPNAGGRNHAGRAVELDTMGLAAGEGISQRDILALRSTRIEFGAPRARVAFRIDRVFGVHRAAGIAEPLDANVAFRRAAEHEPIHRAQIEEG